MTPSQLSRIHSSSNGSSTRYLADILAGVHAFKLAQLNARSRTIHALTGISISKAKQLIIDCSNSNNVPRKGKSIENLSEYINNKKHRRHISYIVHTYRHGRALGLTHVESFIQSYERYLLTLSSHIDARTYIDIDHAFVIIRETNSGDNYDMYECATCSSSFIYAKYDLPLICPFCADFKEQSLIAMNQMLSQKRA